MQLLDRRNRRRVLRGGLVDESFSTSDETPIIYNDVKRDRENELCKAMIQKRLLHPTKTKPLSSSAETHISPPQVKTSMPRHPRIRRKRRNTLHQRRFPIRHILPSIIRFNPTIGKEWCQTFNWIGHGQVFHFLCKCSCTSSSSIILFVRNETGNLTNGQLLD